MRNFPLLFPYINHEAEAVCKNGLYSWNRSCMWKLALSLNMNCWWDEEKCVSLLWYMQGWEFTHRFSERSGPFLGKNKRMSDSLKKTSNLLIHSFLVSDLSKLLMVAHFWWATWAICAHRSILVSDLSNSLTSLIKKEGMRDWESLIF